MLATVPRFRSVTDKRRKPAAEVRRDWQTPALLREYVAMLTQAATRLDEHADAIESAGLKELHCDGVRKFVNGYAEIDRYINNVHKAMIDAGVR